MNITSGEQYDTEILQVVGYIICLVTWLFCSKVYILNVTENGISATEVVGSKRYLDTFATNQFLHCWKYINAETYIRTN